MKLLVTLVFFSISCFATPLWYYKLSSNTPNAIVGFGSGESEAHAKQEAFNDVVGQISTTVDSTVKLHNQEIEFHSLQKSNAVLNEYKLLKMEYSNEKYFVALEYENIPSFDKFVRKVKVPKKNQTQNHYLKSTNMAKKLYNALGKKIDFKLLRKDKKWYIKHDTALQLLDKKDFSRFFTSKVHSGLQINTNKKRNILYDKDRFFFRVNSSKKGYISIFSVYENGTVSTLVRNISIEKDKIQNVPDAEFETIAEAGLITKGIETFDLYVLLYSEKKLRLDDFAYADSEIIDEEKYKNFDELIEFLQNKEFTTLKVVTKPRL